MEKQYYVYLTTNLINNKKYIGKHIGLLNDSYLGSGVILQRAIEKYGKENFKKEILYIAKNEIELNQKEKYYISYFNAIEDPNFYNIADGGQGGYVTKGYSEEQRINTNKKISDSLKGNNHPFYGKSLSEDTKKKISDSLKKYWTEDKKAERSDKYSGSGNPMYGKHHTKESQEKRIAHTDFSSYRTEEYRLKMSLATSGEKNGNYGNKGEKAKNGVHIQMLNEQGALIKEFNTKKLALEFLGVKGHNALDKAIKNKTLYKNYYWIQI